MKIKRPLMLFGLIASTTMAAVFSVVPTNALAYKNPGNPTGLVNDFAGVLTPETKAGLESTLQDLEQKTTVEFSVVTIKSLDGDTIENYANQLFADWKIGKKSSNNGLLLLVAIDDRKARFEVGYGLEGELTDLTTSKIQQNFMIPKFKTGDYNGGIQDAVAAAITVINGGDFADSGNANGSSGNSNSGSGSNLGGIIEFLIFIFFPFIIFIVQFLIYSMSRSKSIWLGGAVFGGLGFVFSQFVTGFSVGFLNIFNFYWIISTVLFTGLGTLIGLFIDYGLSKKLTNAKTFSEFLKSRGAGRRGSGIFFWGSRGGGFGSGSGGGFGGFGGGSSGGGGSSSSW